MLVYYGILAKAGLPYWINAAAVYALLPVIPLALVSLLVIGMMRLVNLSRKKDVLIIVGSLVLIALGIGLQFLVNRSAGSRINQQALLDFLTAPDSLLKRAGAIFPPCIWATKALVGGFSRSGLLHLLLLAGASLAFLYGILVVAERLFYRGLIGLGEISGRKKALSRREMARRVSSGRRPIRAIFRREWRIMNRTPIFLLNGVLTVAIIPVLFLLMTKMGSGRGDAACPLESDDLGLAPHGHSGRRRFHGHLRQPERDVLLRVLARRPPVLDVQNHAGLAARPGHRQVPAFLSHRPARDRNVSDRQRRGLFASKSANWSRRSASPWPERSP